MPIKLRKRIGLGVATGVIALALGALPVSFDTGMFAFDGKTALAAAGGNGNGNGNAGGNGKGNGKGQKSDQVQEAKASHAKGQLSKEDSMHPSNLGRLNGFMNASSQALANASPNSAIGTLSKTYRDALLGYTSNETTVTTTDLAGILAEAANKPLSTEQVVAVHERLIEENPELAEDEAVSAKLTDESFASDLADEANEIQATETNQGLGNDEDDEADDVAEGDDGDDGSDTLADAADAVGDAVTDTTSAIGDFVDETF